LLDFSPEEEFLREMKKENEKKFKKFSRLDEVLNNGFLERKRVDPIPHDRAYEYENSDAFVELFQIEDVTIARETYITTKKESSSPSRIFFSEGSRYEKYYFIRNNSLVTTKKEIKSILERIAGIKTPAFECWDLDSHPYEMHKEIVRKIVFHDELEVDRREYQPEEKDIQEQLSYAEEYLRDGLTKEFGFENTDVAVKYAGILKTAIDKHKTHPAD
jgi:hypothetical protein